MEKQTILVIGATGLLGEPVARRLDADGYRVRVLSRNPAAAKKRFPDFEAVEGDINDLDSLHSAVDGCFGVHLNLPSTSGDPELEQRGAFHVSEAAQTSSVERLTYISGASVFEENCWFPGTRTKFLAEAAIENSTVPFTIFKPTWFMESLPKFVQGNRAMLVGDQPHPLHWVAAEDYARMVARAYACPEAAGKRLFVYGPEAMTMREALERYAAVAHPSARVKRMPIWLLTMVAKAMRKEALGAVLPFMKYCEKVTEGGSPDEANELLGAPRVHLEEWAKQART